MKNIMPLFAAMLIFGPAFAQDIDVFEAAQRAADEAAKAAGVVPSGAVMAFNRAECPEGWVPLAQAQGRVIIGAGSGNRDINDNLLTNRVVGETGGAESHTLTANQMPTHHHTFSGDSVSKGGNHGTGRVLAIGDGAGYGNYTPSGNISNTGGGEPHPIIPPFLILLICERI